MKYFEQIVFEKFKIFENDLSIKCISKCEINNLMIKKNIYDKLTTTKCVNSIKQIK